MALSVADRLDIQELGTRIYYGTDTQDAGIFASYFSEDGVFVAPYGEFTGPKAVKEFMTGHIANGKEDGVKHFLTNFAIDEHPEGARFRFYILKMNVAVGPTNIATAHGDCIVKKTSAGWRFKRFQLSIDPAMFANKK